MDEGEIKKGLNIYLYYWTIVALLVFYLIHIIFIDIVDIMISAVSFLFGFLITISFSILLSRTALLREVLSMETGRLVSLFLYSKHLGEKFHNFVKDKIDEYTIRTLREYTNYEVGREVIYDLFNGLDKVEIKNAHQSSIFDSFLYVLGELEPTREKLESLTGKKLIWSLKLSNYLLGIILIFLLFVNRGDILSNSIFIILSTIVVFILLIIEDYDNLKIGAYHLNIDDSEQIFDLIGRERYYPKNILKMAKLEKGKIYRIGIYDSREKKEKTYKMRYSPYFKSKINTLIKPFKKGKID